MVRRRFNIRIVRDGCSEYPTCPKQIEVAEDPDHTYFVVDTRIDPDLAAALAHHVGEGEAIGRVPNWVAGK